MTFTMMLKRSYSVMTQSVNIYWDELTTAYLDVKSTLLEKAIECFKVENKIEPNENEVFLLMAAFVNEQIIQSK